MITTQPCAPLCSPCCCQLNWISQRFTFRRDSNFYGLRPPYILRVCLSLELEALKISASLTPHPVRMSSSFSVVLNLNCCTAQVTSEEILWKRVSSSRLLASRYVGILPKEFASSCEVRKITEIISFFFFYFLISGPQESIWTRCNEAMLCPIYSGQTNSCPLFDWCENLFENV